MRMTCLLIWFALVLPASGSRADDTDIYLQGTGIGQPWVHILMDFRGALDGVGLCRYGVDCAPPFMSPRAYSYLKASHALGEFVTAAGILRAVFAAVIENPRFETIKLSLLVSNHPANPALGAVPGRGGGTILAGYKPLSQGRKQLLDILGAIPLDAIPADHALQPREAFYEWYRYINGKDVALGTNTAGNFGQVIPYPNFDREIIVTGRYLSPFSESNACPRLYGIVALLGAVEADGDLDDAIAASLPVPPGTGFREMLATMQHPQTDLLPALAGQVPLSEVLVIANREQSDLALEISRAGGKHAVVYVERPWLLENALSAFLDRTLTASGTLLAASVALDVFEQGAILDRFYTGLFQPSGGTAWDGNIKKFKMRGPVDDRESPDVGTIVDVRGENAFESDGLNSGNIRFNALSFWTDSETLPPGDGKTIPLAEDGREVARGGAGQKIDGFVDYLGTGKLRVGDSNGEFPSSGEATRQVFVEPRVPGDFLPFDADAPTVGAVGDLLDPGGALNDAQRLELIRWGRGLDIESENGAARRWILGDVLHSRPLAINYGATPGYGPGNPRVQLFFGSNDGLFHILDDTDPLGGESGRERFAFYPRELLSNIAILRDSALPVSRRPYGVDGEPVALRVDQDRNGTIEAEEGDEVFVYFGLRRGGRSYFALEASDPDVPPRLAWKLSPTGDFTELGLSFSTPLVAKVKYEELPRDVLIFGAGYHGGWNVEGTARTGKDFSADDDPIGNAIFVVDARTGQLVWKAVQGSTGSGSDRHYEHADLVDSIPSAVTALKTPEGLVHRLYVGDTGGGVWRVDLPPGSGQSHRRDNWFISKLADLGADAGEPDGSAVQDLRFFHAPELVRSFDVAGAFDGVLIQSGDRAHPTGRAVENYLFYLKDREVVSGADNVRFEKGNASARGRIAFEDLTDQSHCTRGTERDLTGRVCGGHPALNGWKLRYGRAGEKGLSRPLVDAGRIFATTYTPALEGACTPREGQGHLYAVRLADASALQNGVRVSDLGAGIPADPVYVGGSILIPGRGAELNGDSRHGETGARKLFPSQAPRRYRVYWREPGLDSQ